MLSSDLLIILVIINSALIAGILTFLTLRSQKKEEAPINLEKQDEEHKKIKLKAMLLKQEQIIKAKHQAITIPLKIQAIERLSLLMERTKPESLILRNTEKAATVRGVANLILSEIRQEFDHNSSQQIFVDENTWQLIKLARQQTVTLIQEAAEGLDPQNPAIELSVKVLEIVTALEHEIAHDQALNLLRKELQEYL
ncbi:MAG: hypothetical protein LWX70_12900 [Sphingobacteriia bacterium]|nr:hypothetical protein [Sphingobacteriia bacterium]